MIRPTLLIFSGKANQRSMRRLSNSWSVTLFALGAYLISWPIWMFARRFHVSVHVEIGSLTVTFPLQSVVLLLGDVGPGLAATLIVGLSQGWISVRQLWSGLTVWRLKGIWLAFVGLLMPFMGSVALAAYWLLGGHIASVGNPARWLLLIVVNLPFAPLWEEIGWRGFLLPRLQTKHSGLTASLLLAGVWAPWHLLLYWDNSIEWLSWFFVMIFALAVVFTWVYNRSQGSLVPAVLLHVMTNTTILFLLAPTMRSSGMEAFGLFVGSIACAALAVVLFAGPSLGKNSLRELASAEGAPNQC